MRIQYRPDVPSEIREAVDPLLRRHASLVPTWCHEVVVFYDAENGDDVANVRVLHPYRFAQVTICPPWLRQTAEDREQAIRHELIHIPLAPMTDFVKDLIERMGGEDGRFCEWVQDQWRERFEGAVCDLERAVQQIAA